MRPTRTAVLFVHTRGAPKLAGELTIRTHQHTLINTHTSTRRTHQRALINTHASTRTKGSTYIRALGKDRRPPEPRTPACIQVAHIQTNRQT